MVFDRRFTFIKRQSYKCAYISQGSMVFWGDYFDKNITRLYCEETKEYYNVQSVTLNKLVRFTGGFYTNGPSKLVSHVIIDGVMKKGFNYSN